MQTRFAPSFRLAIALPLVLGTCGTACSTGAPSAERNHEVQRSGPSAAIGSHLSSACRVETIGLPCDPDGSGSATECEGLCWVDGQASVSCVPVAAANLVETDLNGRICGDEQGRDCARSCENGECVDKNARLGTACRPGPNTTTCDGVCTLVAGEPICDEVSVCDDVGVSDDGCTLTTCNFETFEQGCVAVELTNPVCEASQMETDVDAAGAAEAGPQVGADAGSSDSMTAPADAAVNTTRDDSTSRSDAGAASSVATVASSGALDAGQAADGGRPRRTPVRVVGGACSVAQSAAFGGLWSACPMMLSLVLLLTRRGRQLNSRARH